MQDQNLDSLSSIIPLGDKNNSGSFPIPVDVGPQVRARNAPLRNGLERRPVLGIDQSLVTQPLGNGLLADRGAVHEPSDSFSERRLAARDLDGPLEGGNVLFLHNHRDYTTKVVRVNNLGCVQPDNEVCTVLPMRATARKRTAKLTPVEREALRDAQGRTLGDRLRIGMEFKSRMQRHPYTAKDLLKEASEAIGRDPREDPVISQQALSKIMTNKSSHSEATPAFAQVLGLNPLWLAYGVGPRSIADTIQ